MVYIVDEIYVDYPGLRSNLLYYLKDIGYKKRSSKKVLDILKSIDVFDDISLYQLCSLVTEWEVPINDQTKEFLNEFEETLLNISFTRKVPSDFYCLLWFKAKYNHHEDLLNFLAKYQNIWLTDNFLRRQVTAILSRLLITSPKKVDELIANQISSGISSTVSLANQVKYFSTVKKLTKKLSSYLFPTSNQRPYPLPKFLVLCSVLSSEEIRTDPTIRKKIKNYIYDPYYLKWLDAQYNIS